MCDGGCGRGQGSALPRAAAGAAAVPRARPDGRPAVLPGPAAESPSEGGTKWRNLTWPFGVSDSKINSVCPSLPADRVCQQPGLSLWVPFQNAATAVTNLYKGKGLRPAALPAEPGPLGLLPRLTHKQGLLMSLIHPDKI